MVDRGRKTQSLQPLLDVRHRRAYVTDLEPDLVTLAHTPPGPPSAVSRGLGRQLRIRGLQVSGDLLEELTLALGPDDPGCWLPSLKRMRVGMLITSNRRVMSRLSSMLSLATSSLPACSERSPPAPGRSSCTGPPFGPEVHQHRNVRGLDMLIKASVAQVVIFSLMLVVPPARLRAVPMASMAHATSTSSPGRGIPVRMALVGSATGGGLVSSQRSTSMAAMHPEPAAVMAWR